jgi:hypothetical protein
VCDQEKHGREAAKGGRRRLRRLDGAARARKQASRIACVFELACLFFLMSPIPSHQPYPMVELLVCPRYDGTYQGTHNGLAIH